MLNLEPDEPDMLNYKGDMMVKKVPYDPNDPYHETDSIVQVHAVEAEC